MYSFRSVILASLFSLSAVLGRATPGDLNIVRRASDIVFSPNVTSPNLTTTWLSGSLEVVRWNTTGLPPPGQLEPSTGTVVLKNLGNSDPYGFVSIVLAAGVNLTDGFIQIQVPAVPTGSQYYINLEGDAANKSQNFTIQGDISTQAYESSLSAAIAASSAASAGHPLSSTSVSTTVSTSATVVVSSSASASATAPASTGSASSSSASSTPSQATSGAERVLGLNPLVVVLPALLFALAIV